MRINFTRIALLPALVAGVICCFSCAKEKKEVHVKSITLDRPELELTEGEKDTLKATILPSKAPQGIQWISSDEDVASVGENGELQAITAGNAVIRAIAEDNGLEAVCSLTVKKLIIPVTSVSLDKETLPILVGGNYTFKATVLPENATDKSLSWKSDNEDVAMVSQQGKVVGAGVGTAHIIVASTQYPEVTDTCTVTVESDVVAVTGVSLPSTITLTMGTPQTISATIIPAGATNQNVRWTSGNNGVVTVDGGRLTPVASGETDVTVPTVDGGFTATCHVTVKDTPITSISFVQASADPIRIEFGKTLRLDVVFNPENPSNKALNWSSSIPGIATISQVDTDGAYALIYAAGTGNATIKAQSKVNLLAMTTQRVTVWRNPESIAPSADKLTLSVGGTAKLSAVISPSSATERGVSFSSSAPGVARVDEEGNVTAVAAGDAVITITSTAVPSLSCTCDVKVLSDNKVRINGGEPLAFTTGQLAAVLADSTITKIFFQESVLNSVDVVALNTALRSEATDVDITNVSFLADGASYMINGSSETMKLNDPEALPARIFYNCKKVTKLRIPAVKRLLNYCLGECNALSDFILPDTVEQIEGWAFFRTWALTHLDFPASLIHLDNYSLRDAGLSGEIDASHIQIIGTEAFSSSGITKIWLGSALRSVGAPAFSSSCRHLTGVFFKEENAKFKASESGWLYSKDGKTLYSIPYASPGASGTVTIPQGVEVVRPECANGLNMTGLILYEGLKEFGQYSFGSYKGEELTLPSTLKIMSALTFGYSANLKTVTVKAATPPTISNYSQLGAFAHCDNLTAIYVPAASAEAYKAATGWSAHSNIIKPIVE